MKIMEPFINKLKKLTKPPKEICNSFGGYCNDKAIILLCGKDRNHKGDHSYEHTANLGWCPVPKIYVLAENYSHFIYWARISGLKPTEVHYVNSVRDIYGADPNTIFVYYETWRNRWDAKELKDCIDRRKQ